MILLDGCSVLEYFDRSVNVAGCVDVALSGHEIIFALAALVELSAG